MTDTSPEARERRRQEHLPWMPDEAAAYRRANREDTERARSFRQRTAGDLEHVAAKCECEHADHFDNGPGHPYRKAPATGEVTTEYGKFKVCGDCRDGSPSSAHGTKRTG